MACCTLHPRHQVLDRALLQIGCGMRASALGGQTFGLPANRPCGRHQLVASCCIQSAHTITYSTATQISIIMLIVYTNTGAITTLFASDEQMVLLLVALLLAKAPSRCRNSHRTLSQTASPIKNNVTFYQSLPNPWEPPSIIASVDFSHFEI